jgi:adenylate kinase
MIKQIPDRAAWLKGSDARCSVLTGNVKRPWRLVLLGAPGAGKGTQADLLCRHLGACHLSTGDVFRAAKCHEDSGQSPAMGQALEQMKRGELVSDQTVLALIGERVRCLRCRGGFVLDGFPRTVAQARSLEQSLQLERIGLDAVIDYELPMDEIVARLGGRRTCSGCKAVFHVKWKAPCAEGICDHCGAPLVQLEDDRPESIRVRMKAYEDSTGPLMDFYKERGLLFTVAADAPPDEVCQRVVLALEKM